MNRALEKKLKNLRIQKEKENKLLEEERFVNILLFLKNKGLLLLNKELKTIRNKKINVKDILDLARIEPRVIEVFPAAYIRFESKFVNASAIPDELNRIIKELRQGIDGKNEFMGISQKQMLRWCNSKLRDNRSKPLKEKKVLSSFKLSPMAIKKLNELNAKSKLTKTEILETLILQA